MSPDSINPQRAEQLEAVIAELEELNHEAARKNIWIRTRWNSATSKPWHTHDSTPPTIGAHGLPIEHAKPVPHIWKWDEFAPYLRKVAELCPLELTERQSVLLINPALKSGYKVTNTIRIAISIYKPGDVAHSHLHSPNASRTILSETGGYTIVEGERIEPRRGDLSRHVPPPGSARADPALLRPSVFPSDGRAPGSPRRPRTSRRPLRWRS